jgi:capsular polysaccharide biosynthesis protein
LVDSLQKLFVLTNDQASLPNLEAKQVIFMSRPIGLFRRLENSHDVLNQFSLAGIEVIEPSELPVDAVANKLNKAQIVISETGAAFTNLLFCRKGTKVIEIQPPGVDTEFWQSFTKNLGLDHYVIPASKAWLGLRSSHRIPVEKVHAMVTSLLHRDA